MEKILEQIEEILKDFSFSEPTEETKLEALNLINNLLFPLKENHTLEDFYLGGDFDSSGLNLSIFLKENSLSSWESWEITVSKNKESGGSSKWPFSWFSRK